MGHYDGHDSWARAYGLGDTPGETSHVAACRAYRLRHATYARFAERAAGEAGLSVEALIFAHRQIEEGQFGQPRRGYDPLCVPASIGQELRAAGWYRDVPGRPDAAALTDAGYAALLALVTIPAAEAEESWRRIATPTKRCVDRVWSSDFWTVYAP